MKSTRPKFETRRFRLVGPVQVQSLLSLIPHLPLDEARPLEVVVQECPRQRGLDQNALYWVVVGQIAEQAWLDGRQFNSDIWHHFFRVNVMAETVTLKDGTEASKWVEGPDGILLPRSTTELDKISFALYVTAVEAFGANLGVMFSARPER